LGTIKISLFPQTPVWNSLHKQKGKVSLNESREQKGKGKWWSDLGIEEREEGVDLLQVVVVHCQITSQISPYLQLPTRRGEK